jgi:hypothetical protein
VARGGRAGGQEEEALVRIKEPGECQAMNGVLVFLGGWMDLERGG